MIANRVRRQHRPHVGSETGVGAGDDARARAGRRAGSRSRRKGCCSPPPPIDRTARVWDPLTGARRPLSRARIGVYGVSFPPAVTDRTGLVDNPAGFWDAAPAHGLAKLAGPARDGGGRGVRAVREAAGNRPQGTRTPQGRGTSRQGGAPRSRWPHATPWGMWRSPSGALRPRTHPTPPPGLWGDAASGGGDMTSGATAVWGVHNVIARPRYKLRRRPGATGLWWADGLLRPGKPGSSRFPKSERLPRQPRLL